MTDNTETAKGQAINLAEHIQYMADSVVSKTLIKKDTGTVTLFAFDAGQGLSEHTAPFDALVEIIDGAAEIIIGGESTNVGTGQILIMPADIPHALKANQKFKMMLTMIRS